MHHKNIFNNCIIKIALKDHFSLIRSVHLIHKRFSSLYKGHSEILKTGADDMKKKYIYIGWIICKFEHFYVRRQKFMATIAI